MLHLNKVFQSYNIQHDDQHDDQLYEFDYGFPLKPKQFDSVNFADLAQLLMNHGVIEVKNNGSGCIYHYEIIELEFYTKNINGDSCHDKQNRFAQWQFHRSKHGGAYKKDLAKGLDLALGQVNVCIRSIRRYKKDEILKTNICVDPSCVVDQLLTDTNFISITDLVKASESANVQKNKFFQLKFYKKDRCSFDIYCGPSMTLPTLPTPNSKMSSEQITNDKKFRFTVHRLGFGFKKENTLEIIRRTTDPAYKQLVFMLDNDLELFIKK